MREEREKSSKRPDLKIGTTNVTKLLKDTYKKLGTGWVSLIQLPAERHMEVNSEALRILTEDLGFDCVYITLGKTAEELDKAYKDAGIAPEKLYFIDAISAMYGKQKESTKRCVYASGPLDIDSMLVAMKEILPNLESENKCVFLDSITTVLLYNSLPRTIRFSKFLTQNLREMGVNGVMVSVAKGETTEKLIADLKPLCDEFIIIEESTKA